MPTSPSSGASASISGRESPSRQPRWAASVPAGRISIIPGTMSSLGDSPIVVKPMVVIRIPSFDA